MRRGRRGHAGWPWIPIPMHWRKAFSADAIVPCIKCGQPADFAHGSDTEPDLCARCAPQYLEELLDRVERTLEAE